MALNMIATGPAPHERLSLIVMEQREDQVGTMEKDAVLYYTHYFSATIQREIDRVRVELGKDYRLVVVAFSESSNLAQLCNGVPVHCYSSEQISELPYHQKIKSFKQSEYYGHVDLAPLRFFRDHPDHEYYWIIEHDVRFSGNWRTLFTELSLSTADLLCTTVQTWAQNPRWVHWHALQTVPVVNRARLLKGFLPFCRLSRVALHTIDAAYQSGWDGHAEAVWPTSANLANLKIEDIGGYGSFTPPNRKGRYYVNNPNHWSQFPGTFVYRPWFSERSAFGPDDRWPDVLWHPVRDAEG